MSTILIERERRSSSRCVLKREFDRKVVGKRLWKVGMYSSHLSFGSTSELTHIYIRARARTHTHTHGETCSLLNLNERNQPRQAVKFARLRHVLNCKTGFLHGTTLLSQKRRRAIINPSSRLNEDIGLRSTVAAHSSNCGIARRRFDATTTVRDTRPRKLVSYILSISPSITSVKKLGYFRNGSTQNQDIYH